VKDGSPPPDVWSVRGPGGQTTPVRVVSPAEQRETGADAHDQVLDWFVGVCAVQMEENMASRSCSPYRGCHIEVNVTPARSHAFGGAYRRYRVSWAVSPPGKQDAESACFPEQFDFLCEQEAFSYGEKRAHTYIDSILSTPTRKRMAGDAPERTDETPVG